MGSLSALLDGFRSRRVLVLGDVVADAYLVGKPVGAAREAPVLVLEQTDAYILPGGGLNTAANCLALGAETHVIGLLGDDETGRNLRRSIQELGMRTDGLIVDPHRPTSTKTRVVGKGVQEVQQLVARVDRIDRAPMHESVRDRMIEAVLSALPRIDALLISDYSNGVISQEVIGACLPAARGTGKIVVVDSHGDLYRFRGVTAATPNQPEAESSAGRAIATEEDLHAVGRLLLQRMEAESVLITRGSEGIALFETGVEGYLLPIALGDQAQAVDPTGAGDTVAAAFTLALACGASARQAAYVANVAGGEAVRRWGAVTLQTRELGEALRRTELPPPA
ncbi:MAG TPA: bifunctional ADP-heptose synthase [Chloroflexota bacterium]